MWEDPGMSQSASTKPQQGGQPYTQGQSQQGQDDPSQIIAAQLIKSSQKAAWKQFRNVVAGSLAQQHLALTEQFVGSLLGHPLHQRGNIQNITGGQQGGQQTRQGAAD
ncbi:MAG: hypothetical protein NVS2B11_03420 [Acetobacteraceae bacterium]